MISDKFEFDLTGFLGLFDDESFASQAFPPYFILGQITAVASGPELVMPSEWITILSNDPNEMITFSDENQAELFYYQAQSWWNMCVEHYENEESLKLVEAFKFTKSKGASKDFKAFIDGYLMGYDWLKEDWDFYIDDESEESGLLGMTTLLAIQLRRWPKKLKHAEDLPDLVGEAVNTPRELVGFFAKLVSTVGNIGLTLSRKDLFEEKLEPLINPERKVGRNDPCPCGSGKKFKKCCLH